MSITYLKSLDQLNRLIQSNKNTIILIDFHAQWCGPCHAIAPTYESLAKSHPSISFTKCDVDQAKEVAEHYRITAMPTFIFLKGGQKIDQIRGADKSKLETMIKKYSTQSTLSHDWGSTGHKLSEPATSSSSSSTSQPQTTTATNQNSNPLDWFNSLSSQARLGIILFSLYLTMIYFKSS